MPIKLNGATSGSVELGVPDVVGSDVQNVLLPSTAGTLDRLERAGNILQVAYGGTSSQVSISTTSYVDSGLTATITPTSSTSKVLVLIDQSCEWTNTGGSGGMGIRVLRDLTIINEPQATSVPLSDYIAQATQHYFRHTATILDSPATTSAVTYKTQGRLGGATSANFQAGSTTKGTSRIVLMEVAG
jgi:hypothetical protein